MHENGLSQGNKESQFREDLITEYPELTGANGKDIATSISAAFVNGKTVESYLEDIQIGKPTGNVENHLDLILESLNEIEALNDPSYRRFLQSEKTKLQNRRARATEIIGTKIRGNDGIYR